MDGCRLVAGEPECPPRACGLLQVSSAMTIVLPSRHLSPPLHSGGRWLTARVHWWENARDWSPASGLWASDAWYTPA